MTEKERIKAELDKKYSSLIKSERDFVFGCGNVSSDIAFIGEAPGRDEEKAGMPFVGKAGQNLNSFLVGGGIKREDIYITNAVKYRPVKVNEKTCSVSNRTPTAKEIVLFREWLIEELKNVSPKFVVTLGNTPLFALTEDKALKITSVHGCVLDFDKELSFKLMPFYHPAAIIYRRELVAEYEKDMAKFCEYIKKV